MKFSEFYLCFQDSYEISAPCLNETKINFAVTRQLSQPSIVVLGSRLEFYQVITFARQPVNEPREEHAHCFQSLYKAGGSGMALVMQYWDESHLSKAIQSSSCVQAATVSCIVTKFACESFGICRFCG